MGRHLRPLFRAAGLADCRHRTWTIDRQAPLGPDDRAYFAGYLADLRKKASPHLSGDIRDEFERLVDPESPAYLLDSPDFTVTCLNHVAWSVKPGGDQGPTAEDRAATRDAMIMKASPSTRAAALIDVGRALGWQPCLILGRRELTASQPRKPRILAR